jgi:hypothetical protein
MLCRSCTVVVFAYPGPSSSKIAVLFVNKQAVWSCCRGIPACQLIKLYSTVLLYWTLIFSIFFFFILERISCWVGLLRTWPLSHEVCGRGSRPVHREVCFIGWLLAPVHALEPSEEPSGTCIWRNCARCSNCKDQSENYCSPVYFAYFFIRLEEYCRMVCDPAYFARSSMTFENNVMWLSFLLAGCLLCLNFDH